jgi:hypothetical protein
MGALLPASTGVSGRINAAVVRSQESDAWADVVAVCPVAVDLNWHGQTRTFFFPQPPLQLLAATDTSSRPGGHQLDVALPVHLQRCTASGCGSGAEPPSAPLHTLDASADTQVEVVAPDAARWARCCGVALTIRTSEVVGASPVLRPQPFRYRRRRCASLRVAARCCTPTAHTTAVHARGALGSTVSTTSLRSLCGQRLHGLRTGRRRAGSAR